MAKFFDKILSSPWSPLGPVTSPVGMLYTQHKKQKGKAKRREKQGRKEQKSYAKNYEKQLKLFEKDQARYNKELNRQQKIQNKRLDKFYSKYGDESFQKHSALTGGQQGLLHELGKQGKAGLKNLRTPEDFRRVQEERLGKRGASRLEKLLEKPSIMDLQQYEPFQKGQQSIEDLLNPSGQAFQAFAAPELREYNARVRPELVGQYGLGGQNNSAFNAASANAQADLQERLAKLRAGLQQEGRQQALQYGQGIQQGQAAQAGIFGKAAEAAPSYLDLYLKQQGLQAENVLGQNKQAANLAQGALGVNPYHAIYRGAVAPTGYNVTGGAEPIQRFPGLAPLPQKQTAPSYLQQLAGNVIPAATTAAGSAFGGPIGAAAGNAFGNFFMGT